jgi:hypothetical protein
MPPLKNLGSPSLINAVRLRCLYCGKSHLLKPRYFFEFSQGCEPCNYRYEREIGYFSGASWMMTYSVAALSAMLAGGVMVWKYGDRGDLIVAGVPAAIGGLAAIAFIPYGRSLWMYLDHKLHPLTESDHYDKKPI